MIAHIIAIRNLLKNKYRTFISLAMIAGALIAVTVFRGYVLKTLEFVQTTIVNGQFGHLQLAKEQYWSQVYTHKKETMISNFPDLAEQIKILPNISNVSPRMKFYGLLSTESISDSAMVIGIDSQKEPDLSVGLTIIQGDVFKVGDRKIMVGSSLAKRIRIKPGDDVTLVTTTLDQVVNAMDFQVGGVFATGTEEFDSIGVFIDIRDAQKLMNSEAVDVLKISIKSSSALESVQKDLYEKFGSVGMEARTWYQISSLFKKVESFYNTQTGLMFSILVFIVLLGITNTVSMSLNERIGEIGTLRALGQSQTSLLKQFMLESFYLCALALVVGAIASYSIIELINSAEITTEVPGASIPIKVQVGFYPEVVGWFSLALFCVVNFFTAILVYRFVRIKIVEALRYNI